MFHLLLHLLRTQLFDKFSSTRGQDRACFRVVNDVAKVVALEDTVLNDEESEAHDIPNDRGLVRVYVAL